MIYLTLNVGEIKMLETKLRGDDVEITSDLRDYINQHIKTIDERFNMNIQGTAHVDLMNYSNERIKAEITIVLPNFLLRGEGNSNDTHKSIDIAVHDIKQQIDTYGSKVNEELTEHGKNLAFKDPRSQITESKIVRKKRVPLQKMTAEEAIIQMNLIGHDFFVYIDVSDDRTDIVYRRHDGDYGLIKTDR